MIRWSVSQLLVAIARDRYAEMCVNMLKSDLHTAGVSALGGQGG